MAIWVKTSNTGLKLVPELKTRTSGGIKDIERIFTKVNSTTWKEVPITIPFRITLTKRSLQSNINRGKDAYYYTYNLDANNVNFTRATLRLELYTFSRRIPRSGGIILERLNESRTEILNQNYTATKGQDFNPSRVTVRFDVFRNTNQYRYYFETTTFLSFYDGNTFLPLYTSNTPSGKIDVDWVGF